MTENPAVPSEPTTPTDALRNLVAGIVMARIIHGSTYTSEDISIADELTTARAVLTRGEVGMPSPSADEIEKLRDERNEALAELHEANRWLWLARQEGFVPNSGAELPSPSREEELK